LEVSTPGPVSLVHVLGGRGLRLPEEQRNRLPVRARRHDRAGPAYAAALPEPRDDVLDRGLARARTPRLGVRAADQRRGHDNRQSLAVPDREAAAQLSYTGADGECARERITEGAVGPAESPDQLVAAADHRGVDGYPPRSLARAQ